jgi:proliferating cell nuclear antigen
MVRLYLHKNEYKRKWWIYIIIMSNERVLEIKSVQVSPIRNMITALKDVLTDATITFTKQGMKIINFDKTHTILVNVMLHENKFEAFRCDPDKIVVCANTLHLFKVISTMSNDDTLSIYIDKNDYHDGVVSHLGLQYENGNIKQYYNQKLRLIEPDTEELVIPDVEYGTVINIPTTDFQKIVRDMNGISDRIEIKSVGNDLIFSCEGNFASSRIFRTESDGNMEFINKPDASVVVQGEFSLKSLSHFIKCTPLCSNLEIYIGNDLPLIVKYDVASLGSIKLCLASLPSA